MAGRALVVACLLAFLAGCVDSRPEATDKTPPDPWEERWAGRTAVKVADQASVRWHDDEEPGRNEFGMASQLVASTCIFQDRPYPNTRAVTFDKRNQTVWGHTREIAFRLDWTSQDYEGDELLMGYLPTGSRQWQTTEATKRAQVGSMPVADKQWDDPEAKSTDWEFVVCLDDQYDQFGRMFKGSFRLEMWLLREGGSVPD